MKANVAYLAVFGALVGSLSAGAATTPTTRTNASQIRALTQDEAAQKFPVQLRGVVVDEGIGGCVIHDGTAGIYLAGAPELIQPLRRRDLVTVEGVTDPGGFAPIVAVSKLVKVGHGEIPKPLAVTFEQLVVGQADGQWVEVSGIVRSCEPVSRATGSRTALELATGGGRLDVRGELDLPSGSLVDAEVRVRGVCFNQHNSSRQLVLPVLHIPTGVEITVTKPAPAAPFAEPLTSVSQLLRFAADGNYGHRIHATGVVTFDDVGELFWLRDGNHGLRVQSRQQLRLQPGDAVEVVGFPIRGDNSPMLEDANFRPLAITASPAPAPLTNKLQALEHDADLVQLSATLKDIRHALDSATLALDWMDGTNRESVLADVQLVENAQLPTDWQVGSRVRVTGIANITRLKGYAITGVVQPQSQSLQIHLRTFADLQLLQAPPWWTPRKISLLAAAIAVTSLLVASAVVAAARRRVREQKARRALAEAEFAAILHERNRIAREIHDTLAQGLGAISMQLELVKHTPAPDTAATHLATAHRLVRSSLADARASIWNMRSQVLETGDLATALADILHQLTDGTEVKGEFKTVGTPRRLSPLLENNFLRIGQEAITNATKHAAAKTISVTLDFSGKQTRLTIGDDGVGFDASRPPKSAGGFGLVGLRERAAEISADLQLASASGHGTTVTLTRPDEGNTMVPLHSSPRP
ncbi:MAG: hypothetical protein RLZZ350_2078 [Verrucomicrobiota bacterium]|jgi:signal transduction histidine kinase